METPSKLWRKAGKPGSFKDFLKEFNEKKAAPMKNMAGDIDLSATGYQLPKGECEPVKVRTIIIARRRTGPAYGGDILLYAGVGLSVGLLVGLIIKKL